MRHFLTADDPATLLRWAAERIGMPDGWVADSEALGVIDRETGRIVAVGVMNMFHDQGGWVHFASDRSKAWATPDILTGFFTYPFVFRGLRRVTARIAADNSEAQVLALKMGFRPEGVERRGFFNRDVCLFGMLAEECIWIRTREEEDH